MRKAYIGFGVVALLVGAIAIAQSVTEDFPNPASFPSLLVKGALTLKGSLIQSGDAGVSGNQSVGGSLSVSGDAGIAGAESLGGALVASGNVTGLAIVSTQVAGSVGVWLENQGELLMNGGSGNDIIQDNGNVSSNNAVNFLSDAGFMDNVVISGTLTGTSELLSAGFGFTGLNMTGSGQINMNNGNDIFSDNGNGASNNALKFFSDAGFMDHVSIPSLHSSTGTRYLCIDTNGLVSSSSAACSGT